MNIIDPLSHNREDAFPKTHYNKDNIFTEKQHLEVSQQECLQNIIGK